MVERMAASLRKYMNTVNDLSILATPRTHAAYEIGNYCRMRKTLMTCHVLRFQLFKGEPGVSKYSTG